MTDEALRAKIESLLPGTMPEEGREWLTIPVAPEAWKAFAHTLHDDAELAMDYLFCVTGVDWKTHLSMVYHFTSTKFRHTLVVKVQLDRENPEIDTVCDIWRTAEFHEREAYDLFGVQFSGHPDLRRLLLTDDFEGWPLRKDFEDPINMIKL